MSKVIEIQSSFEHLFIPCLLSVSCVLHLVTRKLGSPAFKALQKIGNEISVPVQMKSQPADNYLSDNPVSPL